VTAPSALRAELLHLATGQEADAAAHRVVAAAKAGSFGKRGFPRPARGPKGTGHPGAWPTTPKGQVSMAAGVVAAVAVTSAVFALHGGAPPAQLSAGGPKPVHGTAASPSAQKVAATQLASTPVTPPPANTRPAGRLPGPASGASPAPGTSAPAGPSAPGSTGTPATTDPAPPAPPAPAPAPGTLVVSPAGGYLRVSLDRGATITLTAAGGPVSWSAADISRHASGQVTISPGSGRLASGHSVTVTIRATWRAFGQVVMVNPGNRFFIIWIGGNRPR
jgi:hypothetical protein